MAGPFDRFHQDFVKSIDDIEVGSILFLPRLSWLESEPRFLNVEFRAPEGGIGHHGHMVVVKSMTSLPEDDPRGALLEVWNITHQGLEGGDDNGLPILPLCKFIESRCKITGCKELHVLHSIAKPDSVCSIYSDSRTDEYLNDYGRTPSAVVLQPHTHPWCIFQLNWNVHPLIVKFADRSVAKLVVPESQSPTSSENSWIQVGSDCSLPPSEHSPEPNSPASSNDSDSTHSRTGSSPSTTSPSNEDFDSITRSASSGSKDSSNSFSEATSRTSPFSSSSGSPGLRPLDVPIPRTRRFSSLSPLQSSDVPSLPTEPQFLQLASSGLPNSHPVSPSSNPLDPRPDIDSWLLTLEPPAVTSTNTAGHEPNSHSVSRASDNLYELSVIVSDLDALQALGRDTISESVKPEGQDQVVDSAETSPRDRGDANDNQEFPWDTPSSSASMPPSSDTAYDHLADSSSLVPTSPPHTDLDAFHLAWPLARAIGARRGEARWWLGRLVPTVEEDEE